jgi:hypothetical protein
MRTAPLKECLIILAVYLLLVGAVICCMSGCAKQRQSDPTGDAFTKIDGHANATLRECKQPAPRIDEIKYHQTAIKETVVEGQKANAATLKELADQKARYAALESRWYVKWGRRADVLFWTWLGLGIAGIVLSVFTGGIWGTIGTQILHFIPFSNPFALASSWLASRRSGAGDVTARLTRSPGGA